jgi:hypothetical protein
MCVEPAEARSEPNILPIRRANAAKIDMPIENRAARHLEIRLRVWERTTKA